MIKSVDGELSTSNGSISYYVRIKSGNSNLLQTSHPYHKGQKIELETNEDYFISYYFGDFHYRINARLNCVYDSEVTFDIKDINIEKNLRKDDRMIIETNALVLDKRNMYHVMILDISSSGMKLESETPFEKKKVEIHFVTDSGETIKKKGKVMWYKTEGNKCYYGLKTN